jgi:hypothetical protein
MLEQFVRELVQCAISNAKKQCPEFTPADKLIYLIFPSEAAFESTYVEFVSSSRDDVIIPSVRFRFGSYDSFDVDMDLDSCDSALRTMVESCAKQAGNWAVLVVAPQQDRAGFVPLGATHYAPPTNDLSMEPWNQDVDNKRQI